MKKVSPESLQALDLFDQAMLDCDRAVRSAGHVGGFAHQMHVWLDGPVDRIALQAAISRLSQRHPFMTARLTSDGTYYYWRFRPGVQCLLHESPDCWPDGATLLRHTESLLTAPCILEKTDPIRFQLCHLADGRDLLVVHYNHVAMDANGTNLLFRDLVRMSNETGAADDRPFADLTIRGWLARFPLGERLRALSGLPHRASQFVPGRAITLADASRELHGPYATRIAIRSLDEEQTRRFQDRVMGVAGFRSNSMGVLASVFRALWRHSPRRPKGSYLFTHIGTDLRPRSATGPVFRNLVSLISMFTRPHELPDRDELVRLLNRQLRDAMKHGEEIGILQGLTWLSRWNRRLLRQLRETIHHSSVFYGYLGETVAIGDRLCGVPINQVYQVCLCWAPPGLGMAVTMCRGRLVLATTYAPVAVPEERLRAFLDTIVEDLIR